jgi:hypothetical protein
MVNVKASNVAGAWMTMATASEYSYAPEMLRVTLEPEGMTTLKSLASKDCVMERLRRRGMECGIVGKYG